MRKLVTSILICFIFKSTYCQTKEEAIFWLRDKLKSNGRVDEFGKEEYAIKVDGCKMGIGETSTIYMPGIGTDVYHNIYALYIKDIFLIQTEETNRDFRIRIRTKNEVINHDFIEAKQTEKVDEILIMLNKDVKEKGEHMKIINLLTKIVESCGGTITKQEY